MIKRLLLIVLCLAISCSAQVKVHSCSTVAPTEGTYSDDFNRASLGANWNQVGGGSIYNSTEFQFTGGIMSEAAFWSANAFTNNQFSQVKISNLSTNSNKMGPAVRISADGQSFYALRCYATLCELYKFVSGAGADFSGAIISGYTPTVGDTIRLEVVGTTISAYRCVDGAACSSKVALGTTGNTATDSSLASGSAGINGNYVEASAGNNGRMDDWKGGNL